MELLLFAVLFVVEIFADLFAPVWGEKVEVGGMFCFCVIMYDYVSEYRIGMNDKKRG